MFECRDSAGRALAFGQEGILQLADAVGSMRSIGLTRKTAKELSNALADWAARQPPSDLEVAVRAVDQDLDLEEVRAIKALTPDELLEFQRLIG